MRLIDADALMTKLRRQPMFEKTDFDKKMLYVEKSIIDDMPTIEAEPVIHSKWEITDIDHGHGHKCYHCPECGRDEWRYESTRRCPNCGAKMDLED